jgi:hypothetical protein
MRYKYIVLKKGPDGNNVYVVYLKSDAELAEHIRATFEATDHTIISVTNIGT